MTPAHGRCRRGQRLYAKAPHGHWNTTTFIAAPYLWIDATGIKVRQNGRIVSAAANAAVGANAEGRREILGMEIGPSEAETFWTGSRGGSPGGA